MCYPFTLHCKDNIIYDASLALGTLQDDIVCTNLIHNNDTCSTLYLSSFKFKAPYLGKSLYVPVPIAFHSTLESLFPTRQSLVFCDGEYARIQTSWLINTIVYQNISDALVTFGLAHPLPKLSPIQQGYLISILKLHRKGSLVAPLYDLDEAWMTLLDSEIILREAPIDIQIKLVNMGFRSYFDVNKYILISLENHSWDTLRNIITYYKKHFDFKPYKQLFIMSQVSLVPTDIFKFFLNLK